MKKQFVFKCVGWHKRIDTLIFEDNRYLYCYSLLCINLFLNSLYTIIWNIVEAQFKLLDLGARDQSRLNFRLYKEAQRKPLFQHRSRGSELPHWLVCPFMKSAFHDISCWLGIWIFRILANSPPSFMTTMANLVRNIVGRKNSYLNTRLIFTIIYLLYMILLKYSSLLMEYICFMSISRFAHLKVFELGGPTW